MEPNIYRTRAQMGPKISNGNIGFLTFIVMPKLPQTRINKGIQRFQSKKKV